MFVYIHFSNKIINKSKEVITTKGSIVGFLVGMRSRGGWMEGFVIIRGLLGGFL